MVKRAPRITGWSLLFRDYVNGVDGTPPKHVVTEQELLAVVVNAGRSITPNWQRLIGHCMRALSWRRCSDAVYRRKGHVVARRGGR